jgi:hypothetical protein
MPLILSHSTSFIRLSWLRVNRSSHTHTHMCVWVWECVSEEASLVKIRRRVCITRCRAAEGAFSFF